MMILDCGGEEYLSQMPTDNEIFKNLSEFYSANSTLPLAEEKNIIGLFRKMVQIDNYFEELASTENQLAEFEKANKQQGERKEEMDIEGFEDLPKLFISPIEKLMDEFKGLFKIPRENTSLVSANTLHQQICITSKDQFESTNCNVIYLVWTLPKMNKLQTGIQECKITEQSSYPTQQKDL